MFREITRQLRAALAALAFFSILLGLLYPVVITGSARVVFPRQSQGSLIFRDGRPIGSELIGQPFSDPSYFWSRPSATRPLPYNATASAGSNLGPTNPALAEVIGDRIRVLRAADPGSTARVPVDLVTASGSGLDPHISPAAAEFQVRRVAHARRLDEALVRQFVTRFTEDRQLGLLGDPRVNVLKLNLALDAEAK
jgi:K+-transporting ATPase ATPase C chain